MYNAKLATLKDDLLAKREGHLKSIERGLLRRYGIEAEARPSQGEIGVMLAVTDPQAARFLSGLLSDEYNVALEATVSGWTVHITG